VPIILEEIANKLCFAIHVCFSFLGREADYKYLMWYFSTIHANMLYLVKVRTCGRAMGMTIGAMLEEIQTLYQQHKQSCFLYLSSEVIKVDLFFQGTN